MFTPELLRSLRTYSMRRFASDISAGLIVGIVALPLAVAFAIASGVSPERGLITAVVAGFLISAFGGSRVQIGGPTGAFVVIVYGIVQEFGLSGLLVATFLAGLMLLMMGFARLGSVIRYIPHPVTVGFTSGIAVIIFSSQMRDFLGLPVVSLPADFIGQWKVYWQQIGAIDPISLVMALLCTITLAVWPRITHRVPGSIVVILAATLITVQFDLPVDTIGSRFGEIPSHIPAPAFFEIDLNTVRSLLPAAFAIAMLGAIESLLSAVVADGMTGSRHNPDAELISQGIANIASPLFGGIPATGAIARTATNIRNGATSPVAGIVHAATLLAIMLLFGSYVKHIPMPVLASILVIVAYNMSEWRTFLGILKSPRSDVIVLLATFLLTVVFDLVLAIEVGMVLAVLLFIRRMSQVSQVRVLSQDSLSGDDHENTDDPMDIRYKSVPARTEVYEINGPFFFGTANLFASAARIAADPPLVRIIRMRRVPAIDATGIHMLEKFIHDSGRDGIHVLLSGVHKQPLFALEKAGLLAQVGEENIAENIDVALRRAGDVIKQAISEESAS
jgi:SulP family sulfate permease